jgi:hypothetical protein
LSRNSAATCGRKDGASTARQFRKFDPFGWQPLDRSAPAPITGRNDDAVYALNSAFKIPDNRALRMQERGDPLCAFVNPHTNDGAASVRVVQLQARERITFVYARGDKEMIRFDRSKFARSVRVRYRAALLRRHAGSNN